MVALTASALGLVACGSAGGGAAGGQPTRGSGAVSVLYAGSLVRLMEQTLAPEFGAQTGFRVSGFAGGSSELANEIKGGVRQGDVFVSASPRVDAALEGKKNGRWVTWYVSFARTPLVLGYNPGSAFAAALHREPWFKAVTAPGFRIGRTDPVLDPKGRLTVEAVKSAARKLNDRSLLHITSSSANVFPEEALLGRLETGQLDAGFFYLSEAKEAGLSTVSLAPASFSTVFTVTVLSHARDESGAIAFARFLLGAQARHALASAGFELIDPPRHQGPVPAGILGRR